MVLGQAVVVGGRKAPLYVVFALRDADCAFIGSGTEGGSVQPMIVNQCLAEKTVEREAFLASLMQCEEGDLSCPLPPG